MSIDPKVLYGVNLDDPGAIRLKLNACCIADDTETLTGLLNNKTVRKQIDIRVRVESGWPPLGQAMDKTKSEAALVLIRHGADICCVSIAGSPIEIISSKKSMPCIVRQRFTPVQQEALYIAMVANRLLHNDVPRVCSLLSTDCASWHLFNAKKLLAETELYLQETKQDSNTLAKTLMIVTSHETIPDSTKEEFGHFCKQKCGLTALDNEKPEQQKLEEVLQSICSQLLMSPNKSDLLQALGLDDSHGPEFIHVITNTFAKNFSEVFKKLFIDNPEEAESILIENYSPLFSDLLQIYHYHVPIEYKEQLQNILVNLSEKALKEPIALGLVFSLNRRVTDLQRENNQLNNRVLALEETVRKLFDKIGL